MDAAAVREAAADLPREPGVYQFQAGERVLYVGKAVDLRDRVRSYADPRSQRIAGMVDAADGVDVAVTDTETQALLLEANLVKRHQPRYNVRLKDDKSYPLVQFTDHDAPRIEVTRDPAEGATVYGPYTSKAAVETVVKAVRSVYGLRGCSDHKYANRDRPCLDYEMGLCDAPCTGEVDPETYRSAVREARRFFEGETGALADPLRERMTAAAAAERFERAATLRDRLDAVEGFHGGGGAAVADEGADEQTVDVLGVAVEGERVTVARLHSDGGQLVERDRHRMAADEVGDERGGDGAGEGASSSASAGATTDAAALAAFVPQFYAERPLPDALLLPTDHGDPEVAAWLDAEGVAVRVPGAGREARLVDLALKNARRRGGDRDEGPALAAALSLEGTVERVEGFDVSHTGGRAAVGSDVAFVDGQPSKADYRRKRLTERNDDYANVRELLAWRARRAVEGRDDRPDPDLLLIDGGRGQLAAAREALDEAGWSVPAVALAKQESVVYTPERAHDWPDDAPHLHLLQRVRDEAHRFAVQYHGSVRDEVSTALDDVDGVGPALRERLLRRFGSVEGVRAASETELRDVEGVGAERAATIARRL